MYDWHLREINGKSNMGWLCNCLYSTLQTMVCTDLTYYASYVMLRGDGAHKLMSYPYYMKYAKKDDATHFRHIDLNVPDLIKGRGAHQIQGSVSFTLEDETNCTEMLLGMHKHLQAWWDQVSRRGLNTDGFVHHIENTMFTLQDAWDFGIN